MTLHMPPDKLDDLLSDHLATTLDPQRGRAAAAFRAHLATRSPTTSASFWRREVSRKALWYWAGVPSALAACVALALTLHFVQPGNDVSSHPAGNVAQDFSRFETARDENGGMAVLGDNTPVRVIRRETLTHTQWQDPIDHATYTVTEPGEQVGYVKVQPY